MGCDAAASALTVLFSFPFSHHHPLTVLQLSRIHFHFSPLLSLKWCCLLAIFLAASLLLSIYGCCSPSLFISPLTLAAVQNSLSLFTFACSLCFFVFCLTLQFSLPFSHHYSFTVMQLSKTHLQFSLLLFLKWLPSALFWHYYSLIVWSALSISIYGSCSPSLFHITILFRYAAAVQNRFSLFTFAFCLTVLFSLPFSHPELTLHFSLLLSFFHITTHSCCAAAVDDSIFTFAFFQTVLLFGSFLPHYHSLSLCCCRPEFIFTFHFCFLSNGLFLWPFSPNITHLQCCFLAPFFTSLLC